MFLRTTKALSKFSNTKVTTLPNGLRVVSEDSLGHFVALGAYVRAGSRFESPELRGVSHFIDRLSLLYQPFFKTKIN